MFYEHSTEALIMKKVRLTDEEKLPWELIEEILYRVPPKSLVCFRSVSKKWNTLFEDRRFLNSHKSTFRFVLTSNSKFYSVSIDPEIVVRELALNIPLGFGSQEPKDLVDCNVLLVCRKGNGTVVWNPWLKHTRVIKDEVGQTPIIHGIGYDINKGVKESGYKTIAPYWKYLDPTTYWTIYDFATDAWKERMSANSNQDTNIFTMKSKYAVSLNGKMFWVASSDNADPLYLHIDVFDFSRDSFHIFCDLPCLKNHPCDVHVLGIFKGDRLSLLKQCHLTKKIEVWVMKNNMINNDDVVWMSFMKVSIPNLPVLVQLGSNYQPSYFLDDKRLVVCCCDETGLAWIYIMGENKLISKTRIDSMVSSWPLHCTYFPSLTPVPQCPREESELQV